MILAWGNYTFPGEGFMKVEKNEYTGDGRELEAQGRPFLGR